ASRPLRSPALPALPAEAGDRNGLLALLDRSPLLRRALAEAAVAEARVGEAQAERRPDPTLSLRGGRETDERLVGLAVSIPLFVRNDFSAEVTAAQAEAARAQAERDRLRRRALARLEAATVRYRLTREALNNWRGQGRQSLEDRTHLLGRLWRAGEIGATEYLVQLQQTLDTRAAALELEREAWQAWVEWLDAAGQASAWLGLPQSRPEPDA
ncbi:TolC family protein, partial [Thiohalobacter sp.]|uniref:TolC family protein n=1 Tax=Thiohalobacter sp. TaxID=2025948 RepID=UPI0026357278